jgi:hypothetical protein
MFQTEHADITPLILMKCSLYKSYWKMFHVTVEDHIDHNYFHEIPQNTNYCISKNVWKKFVFHECV